MFPFLLLPPHSVSEAEGGGGRSEDKGRREDKELNWNKAIASLFIVCETASVQYLYIPCEIQKALLTVLTALHVAGMLSVNKP